MSGPLFDRVAQLNATAEKYLSLLAASPPLLSVVLGLWVAGLQLATGGAPLAAFTIMVPIVLVVQYSVQLATESKLKDDSELSPVELLKRRYVNGAIDHEEFDRRMGDILSVDTPTRNGETTSSTTEFTGQSHDSSRTLKETADSQQ